MTTGTEIFERMVEDHLAPVWKRGGWSRTGHTFYRVGTHGYALLNIQKSRFSPSGEVSFCINAGVYFPALAALERGVAHTALPAFPPRERAFPAVGRWYAVAGRGNRLEDAGRSVWWNVTAETSADELFSSVNERFAAFDFDVDRVTDLAWASQKHEQLGNLRTAAELALAAGNVERASSLGLTPRVTSDEPSPALRGFIEYHAHHQVRGKRVDAAWDRVEHFLRLLTDGGVVTRVTLDVWDVDAPLKQWQVPSLRGLALDALGAAGYQPSDLVRRVFRELGPGIPGYSNTLRWTWEPDEGDDFKDCWHRFHALALEIGPLPMVKRDGPRSARDEAQLEVSVTHELRWLDLATSERLPFQDRRYYLDPWKASSTIRTSMGSNQIDAAFHFPFEHRSGVFETLWSSAGEALGMKLGDGKLRLRTPNQTSTDYVTRTLRSIIGET